MISTGLKRGGFYGWIALAGAMLVYFCGAGILYYSYGVFLPSISEAFGWSRSALSGPYSLRTVFMGLLGPLVGISVSKFGPRKNIIFGNLVAALGVAGMFLVRDIWHVYFFFSVVVGIGNAFGFFIATISIANNWFVKRKAFAISLVIAAGGIGGFVFPPLIAWLISGLGWRVAWVCLAIIHLVLTVGIGGILIRNRPEDVGQVPDGKVGGPTQEAKVGRQAPIRVYQTPVDWKAKDALRTRTFWLLVIFLGASFYALSLLSTHQVVYLQDLGFSSMTAATAFGLFVGVSIVGRLGVGALGSRFENRYLAAACLAGFAVGMVILMNARALPIVYLYALIGGISYGGLLVLESSMFGAYYGRANYAQIMGWYTPLSTFIGATGPLFAGFIYDYTGSYMLAFIVAVSLLGVGLVCALLARPPEPRRSVP